MPSQLYGSSATQRKIASGLLSLALFGAAQLSHAAIAPITLQNTAGAWTSYTLAPEALLADYYQDNGAHAHSLVNLEGLSWGEADAGPQSSLVFTPTSNGQQVVLGVTFALGTLTHFNQDIYTDTAINSANLRLNLAFLGGNESSVTTGPFDYNFSIFESLNSGTCPSWQSTAIPCDDKISFSSMPSSQKFTLNGVLYSLNMYGFSGADASQMITTENMVTTQNLMASITAVPTPVPVPAALWLLGSGLLGLAGFAKRKHTHQ